MGERVHDDRLYLLFIGGYGPAIEVISQVQCLREIGAAPSDKELFGHLSIFITGPGIVYRQFLSCCGVCAAHGLTQKEGVADVFNGVFNPFYKELAVAPYAVMHLIALDDACQPLCFLSRFLVFGALFRLHVLSECLLEIVAAPFANEVLQLCSHVAKAAVFHQPLYGDVHLLDDV